jgi:hypothetical protein
MKTFKIKKSSIANVVVVPVLIPDEEDLNGDIISSEEIQKTAYEFIENLASKEVNIDHTTEEVKDAEFVESYIAPIDLDFGDGETVPKGSWIVGIKLSDKFYEMAMSGEFVGVSMEGFGFKQEI